MKVATPSSCSAIMSALLSGIVAFIAAVISVLLGTGAWVTGLVYLVIGGGTFGVLLLISSRKQSPRNECGRDILT